MMKHIASFRFYNSLNDFLSHRKRNQQITYHFNGNPSVKDAIEALGVPHVEVEAIMRNGSPVLFSEIIEENDRIEVYPAQFDLQLPHDYCLRSQHPQRFILDVHLGSLARKLRLLGFDTYYQTDLSDKHIADVSFHEQRIVLTRDIGLLKQKIIEWGYWLRSQHTGDQLKEVLQRFSLYGTIKPFNRCLACNGIISSIPKELVSDKIPSTIQETFADYYQCQSCKKIYWKGSHYDCMMAYINAVRSAQTQS